MGLDRYGASRVRFTFKNRRVNKSTPHTSQKVLADSKDQRPFGGKCTYFATCTALEAHQRLKTDKPCPELSWQDLESKVDALTDVNTRCGLVMRCLTVLKRTGIRYESTDKHLGVSAQDTVKITDFTKIDTKKPERVHEAIKKYLKEGPMIGTFEVYGNEFDRYGQSTSVDDIYVATAMPHVRQWTHVVCITGFGVQGAYPFWEFQNSYGPLWRGAARGFG